MLPKSFAIRAAGSHQFKELRNQVLAQLQCGLTGEETDPFEVVTMHHYGNLIIDISGVL